MKFIDLSNERTEAINQETIAKIARKMEGTEPYGDFEMDVVLLSHFMKSTGTVPFEVLSENNKNVIEEALRLYSGDEQTQLEYPKIAIPVKINDGRYAGLFIRHEMVIGEDETQRYVNKAMWVDPSGKDTMPQYVKDMLKESMGITDENIFISASECQPLKEHITKDGSKVLVTDNNSGPIVLDILKKLSSEELYLEYDDNSEKLKLHDEEGPIEEQDQKEFSDVVKFLRQQDARELQESLCDETIVKKDKKTTRRADTPQHVDFRKVLKSAAVATLLLLNPAAAALKQEERSNNNTNSLRRLDDRKDDPTWSPTLSPTFVPTYTPSSSKPSNQPTYRPTSFPSISQRPTIATKAERKDGKKKGFPNEGIAVPVGALLGTAVEGALAIFTENTMFGNLVNEFGSEVEQSINLGPGTSTAVLAAGSVMAGGLLGSGVGAGAAAIYNKWFDNKSSKVETKEYDHTKTEMPRDNWGKQNERIKEWSYLGGISGGAAVFFGLMVNAMRLCASTQHARVGYQR